MNCARSSEARTAPLTEHLSTATETSSEEVS